MSTFNATIVPSRRPPAFMRHEVLFGELPAAVNTVQTYESLKQVDESTYLGWSRSGGINNDVKWYFHQALQKILELGLEPTTPFDSAHVRLEVEKNLLSYKFTYMASTRRCQYHPWRDYIHTLDMEYDPEKFLNLLLLHESAGLYIGRKAQSPIIYDMSKLIGYGSEVIVDYKNCNALKSSIYEWSMQGGVKDLFFFENQTNPDPYNPFVGESTTYDHNLDIDTINAVKNPNYRGANFYNIASFLIELSRFRERCLAKFLGQTLYMLDVVKLTDLDTVRTMYQYFTMDPMAIAGKIGMHPSIMLYGSSLGTYEDTVSWDDFSNVKLRFAGNSGKIYDLSIPEYLKIQFDSVIWLLMDNLNKLEARIDQLQTPTAQLIAQAPIPWILDPYENPFLIYDKEMSDKLNESRFKNVAASIAQQPSELARGVSSVVIPKASYDNAPKIRAHLLRHISTEGGALINLDELTGSTKSSQAPWLLAALAAGAAFLAMKG